MVVIKIKKIFCIECQQTSPCGFLISIQCGHDESKYKNIFGRSPDCMTKFCDALKEIAQEIIYLEHKEILCLIIEELDSLIYGGEFDFDHHD